MLLQISVEYVKSIIESRQKKGVDIMLLKSRYTPPNLILSLSTKSLKIRFLHFLVYSILQVPSKTYHMDLYTFKYYFSMY